MPVNVRYQPPRVNLLPLLQVAARAGEHAMAEVMIEQSRPNVPVELGRLRDSGRVVDAARGSYATYGADDAEISVGGFRNDGGGDTAVASVLAATNDYVVIQHEDDSLNHPNGGGPGWLEKARHSAQAAMVVAARVAMHKVLR